EVRDLLPELATGVAAGDERARALTHLAGCAACRQQLDEMTTVVDELVLLAPEHEPSPGFENAVLAAVEARPRARSRRSPVILAAAASLIGALLAGGLVWWQTADDRDLAHSYRQTLAVADGQYFAAAHITSTDEPYAGHAFAYEGSPSWVFVTIKSAPSSGDYRVQLVTTDQRTIDVGRCRIVGGKGSWGWTSDVRVGDIARIQLVHPGVPTMAADFAT
ncbi:MAG: zf-HC2 domain-containing protein, partial [Actinomycetes bacterium]